MFSAWRPQVWRWFTNKRENVPKIVAGLFMMTAVTQWLRVSIGNYESLPGFTHDYAAVAYETTQSILDEEKIRVLAERRKKMLKDREEAELFRQANGVQPRATNQHVIVNHQLRS